MFQRFFKCKYFSLEMCPSPLPIFRSSNVEWKAFFGGNLGYKFFLEESTHSYGYVSFLLSISSSSLGNSDNKCLKSLSSEFPAKSSKEAFQNCSESKIQCFY